MTKKTVMISCVTFETSMVSQPAMEYKTDEIHIFHYVRADGFNPKIYQDFYKETIRQLEKDLPKIKIVEHQDSPVYDFSLMLSQILSCIDGIPDSSKILINVSSGTAEFIAAGTIASMMSKGKVQAFTVRTSEYTLNNEDDIKKAYYQNGRPVGLSKSVSCSTQIPYFQIERPDETIVRGLRLYMQMKEEGKTLTKVQIIAELKKNGLWTYSPSSQSFKTPPKQKETMYYQRHFESTWEANKWVDRPSRKARLNLTPAGRNILNIFFTNPKNP